MSKGERLSSFGEIIAAIRQLPIQQRIELLRWLNNEHLVPTLEEIDKAVDIVVAQEFPNYRGKTGLKTTHIYMIRDILVGNGTSEWIGIASIASLFNTFNPAKTAASRISLFNTYFRIHKTGVLIQSQQSPTGQQY